MSETHQPPPDALLFQSLVGFMVSKSLSAVAELGVADKLQAGPLSGRELARAVHADERFLCARVMSPVGIDRDLRRTGAGRLRVDPRVGVVTFKSSSVRLRDLAAMLGSVVALAAVGSAATGNAAPACPARESPSAQTLSRWFQRAENKTQWDLFNAAMTSFSSGTSMAVADSYDFSRFRNIVDIGGGRGFLLRAVLAKAPNVKGTLFNLPGVFEGDGIDTLGGRITCVGGDFFTTVPEGGDCYLLKHIVHDWDDDRCRALLTNIARAMDSAGTVIVVEMVMPQGQEPHFAKFADINMLAFTEGGCERTEQEFASLFESAGLQLKGIRATPTLVGVPFEAVDAASKKRPATRAGVGQQARFTKSNIATSAMDRTFRSHSPVTSLGTDGYLVWSGHWLCVPASSRRELDPASSR